MAHNAGSEISTGSRFGQGRTFLIGGSLVAAGLASFYINMLQKKKVEQAAHKNPYHEQVIAGISHKTERNENLQPLNVAYSDYPPAYRRNDHYSGHMTIQDAKASPDYNSETRRLVPPPQRGRDDGSGKAYTKSPDYAKNYGKTSRGREAPVTML
ncbi:hypothetical protein FA15DRAFT_49981 [Coprinopsis marcescibilis]|uniref:Uncharacterized protein n=1 Tax=Coprinopsis marcescibilis TaxID=230819 RepID=A0A5C3KPB1_COPMA|nr:hypothetical protein FA15DRAFT_49981 [Coprinopsis marcescibilis]